MGNPRCQGDRALAGYRTNDSLALARHQPTASLAAQDAEQHQLECVVPGDALSIQGEPVHPRARSWLQYRLTLASSTVISKSKLPLSNFRAKAVESERELTSTPNNSSGTLAKTIQTINCSFLPPSYVYLTWLAMLLA